MKRRILIGLVVILALLGAASAGLADSDSRPFKGSGAGTWWMTNPPGTPDPDHDECDPFGEAGPPQPYCVIEGESTVIVTHLGKGTLEYEHVSDWSDPLSPCAPMREDTTPTFTFTAANGDELSGTYEGAICVTGILPGPPPIVQLGGILTFTVTHGTGRFDPDATGEFVGTTTGAQLTPVGGDGTWSFEGRIGY